MQLRVIILILITIKLTIQITIKTIKNFKKINFFLYLLIVFNNRYKNNNKKINLNFKKKKTKKNKLKINIAITICYICNNIKHLTNNFKCLLYVQQQKIRN